MELQAPPQLDGHHYRSTHEASNARGLVHTERVADWPLTQRNVWRYTFLHPTARSLFDDWESQLRICVTHLRALSGLEPDAPDLAAIVGELVVKALNSLAFGAATTSTATPEDTKPSTTPKSAT